MLTEREATHLVSSRNILAIYEANGLPGGPIEGTMRMLGEEIAFLRDLARRGAGGSIGDLIARWEALRDRVRVRAH